MYLDTFGIIIELTVNFDLTGNTSVTIDITDPADIVTSRAVSVTDLATGVVEYLAEEGHFPSKGNHLLQVVADFGANKRLRSDRVSLVVC